MTTSTIETMHNNTTTTHPTVIKRSNNNIYTPNPAADYRFIVKLQDGRTLVSCHADNAVLVANEAGDVVSCVETEFSRPEGIAVNNSTGEILIVDRYNHCIQVLNNDLKHQRSIVTDFQPCGKLNQPVGIAISSTGDRIFVADNENHRVLILDAKGKYLDTLGKGYGTAPGNMYCPCGIALYNHPIHGELAIVSEWGGGRVQVFRVINGDLFSIFGGIAHAHHVVVDQGGVVYVSEYATRRIKRFCLDGDWRDQWGASAVSLVVSEGSGGLAMVVTQKQVIQIENNNNDSDLLLPQKRRRENDAYDY
jgi:DNA-binding beta-propeller fold protein YncE